MPSLNLLLFLVLTTGLALVLPFAEPSKLIIILASLFQVLSMVMIFFWSKFHIISCLLILELMMLSNLSLSCSMGLVHETSSVLFFCLFTLAVCEASLGVSLLIKQGRLTGGDSMKFL